MRKEIKKELQELKEQYWTYTFGNDVFETLFENETEKRLKKEIKNIKRELQCYIEAMEKIERML